MNPTASGIHVTTTTPASRRASVSRHDRAFYGSIAIALALTVFIGFGPTYYFGIFSGSPVLTLTGGPVTPLVHVHATLFSVWCCCSSRRQCWSHSAGSLCTGDWES